MRNQKGYIVLPLIIFALIAAFLVIPRKFPVVNNSLNRTTSNACAPEDLNNPNAPSINAPSFGLTTDTNGDGEQFTINNDSVLYKRVKANVPIPYDSFLVYYDLSRELHWTKYQERTVNGKRYMIYYPTSITTYDFIGRDGQITRIDLFKHGLIGLVHLNDDGSIETEEGFNNYDPKTFWITDLYVNPAKEPLPDDVINCIDQPRDPGNRGIILTRSKYASQSGSSTDYSNISLPSQNNSPDGKQLQLEWFVFGKTNNIMTVWWTPHCKPAIYLYPQKRSFINVKVYPRGNFTYTDPVYDLNSGWKVWAEKSGEIYDMSYKKYDYLYYEAQIRDSEIKKPKEGYVVRREEIPELLSDIMPKLGLNAIETRHFKEYWERVLPESSYYFIGVVDPSNLDYIEPLDINPKPDSVIRVSLYFEALDSFKVVSEPKIVTPKREGFSVVEWGGLIKLHKDTPFTCSQ